jgi:hypothetical protein
MIKRILEGQLPTDLFEVFTGNITEILKKAGDVTVSINIKHPSSMVKIESFIISETAWNNYNFEIDDVVRISPSSISFVERKSKFNGIP